MGKDWDKALPSLEIWKQCFRVLKEGKLAFIMCSPRQDVLSRMIINLEDAGFRTNYTSIYWTYASGFPKAANVSKLIDKRNNRYPNEDFRQYLREKLKENNKTQSELNQYLNTQMVGHYVGISQPELPTKDHYYKIKQFLNLDNRFDELIERTEAEREIIGNHHRPPTSTSMLNIGIGDFNYTKPATEEAKKMEGAYVGFQPKPAVEVILVVSKGKTLTWLDDCRIPYQSEQDKETTKNIYSRNNKPIRGNSLEYTQRKNPTIHNYNIDQKGRFPANLCCGTAIEYDINELLQLQQELKNA